MLTADIKSNKLCAYVCVSEWAGVRYSCLVAQKTVEKEQEMVKNKTIDFFTWTENDEELLTT